MLQSSIDGREAVFFRYCGVHTRLPLPLRKLYISLRALLRIMNTTISNQVSHRMSLTAIGLNV